MTPRRAGRERIGDARLALAAATVAFLAYLPALWTGFSADDFLILSRLRDAGGLRDWSEYFRQGFFGYYRPLTFVSHAVDWEIWGANAAGFHLTSLLLHAANAALVYVLGRQLAGRTCALAGAVLFGVHPAAHESVYWMSARFDLLATTLTLIALVLLLRDPPPARESARESARGTRRRTDPFAPFAIAVFALALLAKESAVALPVLVLAHDVIVRRRRWPATAWRMLPLLVAIAAYASLRAWAGGLAAAGGRLPKLAVLAGALLVLLVSSMTTVRRMAPAWLRRLPAWAGIAVGATAILAALAWPPSSAWMREKLGFVAYVAFHVPNPFVLPPPSPRFFTPATAVDALPGFAVAMAIAAAGWRARRWLGEHRPAAYGVAFVAAALIPVLSLTGSPRYVYLATAGAALLAGYLLERLEGARRLVTAATLVVFLAAVPAQLVAAASAWRWGSAMVRDGVIRMSAALEPCGTRDLLLLTAPKGIRGVYPNVLWDAFEVTTGCTPATMGTLMIVERVDARVEIAEAGPEVIEMRVPAYAGQIVASTDLRTYDAPVPAGARAAVDTLAGRLETWPDGDAQVFRLHPAPKARASVLFYYSDGAMHALPARRVGAR
jgi:hypothetical protein